MERLPDADEFYRSLSPEKRALMAECGREEKLVEELTAFLQDWPGQLRLPLPREERAAGNYAERLMRCRIEIMDAWGRYVPEQALRRAIRRYWYGRQADSNVIELSSLAVHVAHRERAG